MSSVALCTDLKAYAKQTRFLSSQLPVNSFLLFLCVCVCDFGVGGYFFTDLLFGLLFMGMWNILHALGKHSVSCVRSDRRGASHYKKKLLKLFF